VVGICLGQPGQPRAIEVDPVVVDEVRVLARVHSARAEDLPALLLIDLHHSPDDPLALRDLVLHLPGGSVHQVQVVPAVALGHPDHLFAVADVVTQLLAGVGEEGLGLLADDGAGARRGGIHFDDAEPLVSPLVVLEGNGRAVLAPLQPRKRVRIRKQTALDVELPLRFDMEQDRLLEVESVPRLRVEPRRVLWLELILRRRLDVVDEPSISRPQAVGRELWRNRETRRSI
jgi:hypothetical protein